MLMGTQIKQVINIIQLKDSFVLFGLIMVGASSPDIAVMLLQQVSYHMAEELSSTFSKFWYLKIYSIWHTYKYSKIIKEPAYIIWRLH